VFLYQGRLQNLLMENIVELEDVDYDDGQCINIKYKNDDTEIVIAITASNIENTISFTETSIITNDILNEKYQKLLTEIKTQIVLDYQNDEDKLEEEFQQECAIEYVMDIP
jgi:hypothetical protein